MIFVTDEKGETKYELLKTNGLVLKKGWKVTILSGGGGGYGNPCERDAEKVRKDYGQGYITREHAKKEYSIDICDICNAG